jgi:hypothetical protein
MGRTAPARDGWSPRLIALLGLGLVVLAGLSMFVAVRAAPAQPAPAPRAIGDVGHLREPAVWVDKAGLAAWDRATANRDERGKQAALRLYEVVMVEHPGLVVITARDGENVQIEVADGPLAGRRGWTHATNLLP